MLKCINILQPVYFNVFLQGYLLQCIKQAVENFTPKDYLKIFYVMYDSLTGVNHS